MTFSVLLYGAYVIFENMPGFIPNLFLFCILCSFIRSNLSTYNNYIKCTPTGVCKCEFPNGLGVDLNLLRGYTFSVPVSQESDIVFYPCKNVEVIANNSSNATHNECKTGVSLCLEHGQTYYYNLGSVNESSFLWERITDKPVLVFKHNKTIANILLECDENSKSHDVKYVSATSKENYYNFVLTSNLACVTSVEAQGRSVLSTLFIIILFLFLVYFFGGFCVLRFIRGARGWEAIPNGEFWKSVISGTKKMFLYLINGCKHPEPYDTI